MIDSEIEMKELGKLRDKAPRNTYNKRSLIRTSHVCHRRLVSGRSQQAEEYKHKHKHIHTHTHTHTPMQSLLNHCYLFGYTRDRCPFTHNTSTQYTFEGQ